MKLIRYSPKRKLLFSEKLIEDNSPFTGIKPLCPTRWTVRTDAIEAVIKQYSIIMETLDEVNHTTHDEYGLKAGGVLATLEKFETLFGLKLSYLLFGASEETSKVLQAKIYLFRECMFSSQCDSSFFSTPTK